jgi:uncharacterized protein YbgA (DUF1722 family)/uncharacterized protein YbbK (DUF523 family)
MELRTKPKIIVSKCLGFANCRYNGAVISDAFVEKLKPFVEFIPVCPEVEIGLGVPRDPIRLIKKRDTSILVQTSSGLDCTDMMESFADNFLTGIKEADGFILKSRSPSCGVKDVKLYFSDKPNSRLSEMTKGKFAEAVFKCFPDAAIEDEGRLTNYTIRGHFLTRLFITADFRKIKQLKSIRDLTDFQARNKLLLMAYNEKEMRELGAIASNNHRKPAAEVFEEYEKHLYKAFSKPAGYKAVTNSLMHAFGYVSEKLSKDEKEYFLAGLKKYKTGRLPLSAVTSILESWVLRFAVTYLKGQTLFMPYYEELNDITDSGKGRDY